MVVGAVLATGTACAGSTPSDTPSRQTSTASADTSAALPQTSPGTVAAGVSLASMGFLHGPEAFTVPAGLDVRQRVDQSNVVTLVVPADQGGELLNYLEARLPAAGFTITARSADSLIFGTSDWQGAFTMSDSLAGLTLRQLNSPAP